MSQIFKYERMLWRVVWGMFLLGYVGFFLDHGIDLAVKSCVGSKILEPSQKGTFFLGKPTWCSVRKAEPVFEFGRISHIICCKCTIHWSYAIGFWAIWVTPPWSIPPYSEVSNEVSDMRYVLFFYVPKDHKWKSLTLKVKSLHQQLRISKLYPRIKSIKLFHSKQQAIASLYGIIPYIWPNVGKYIIDYTWMVWVIHNLCLVTCWCWINYSRYGSSSSLKCWWAYLGDFRFTEKPWCRRYPAIGIC